MIHYLEVISHALKPGGTWINFGPLLYHFEGMKNELSIELNADDLRQVIQEMGFDFKVSAGIHHLIHTTFAKKISMHRCWTFHSNHPLRIMGCTRQHTQAIQTPC